MNFSRWMRIIDGKSCSRSPRVSIDDKTMLEIFHIFVREFSAACLCFHVFRIVSVTLFSLRTGGKFLMDFHFFSSRESYEFTTKFGIIRMLCESCEDLR